MTNSVGIQIGATSECISDVRRAILDILNTSAGDEVKINAIKVLQAVTKVEYVTVSGCCVNVGTNETPSNS